MPIVTVQVGNDELNIVQIKEKMDSLLKQLSELFKKYQHHYSIEYNLLNNLPSEVELKENCINLSSLRIWTLNASGACAIWQQINSVTTEFKELTTAAEKLEEKSKNARQ